jgi:hypothetical protein
MKKTIFLIILALPIHCIADDEFSEENLNKILNKECRSISKYATNGKQYFDQKQFNLALQQFENQVTWSSVCSSFEEETRIKIAEKDIISAESNVGLTYARLGKPMLARAWFSISDESKISQYNIKNLPPPEGNSQLNGTYIGYVGYGRWNTISVDQNKNQYDIGFQGYAFNPKTAVLGAPNMGEFYTEMPFNSKTAVYKNTEFSDRECFITIQFEQHQLKVTQTGYDSDCGFGGGVNSSGIYYQIESENE